MVPSRTQLYEDPKGRFIHDLILAAADRNPENTAIVDSSDGARFTVSELADLVDAFARNLAGIMKPGERLAIFLPNSWEFCVAFHGASMAGVVPTPLNPSYREREVRYQLENSGASMLITDGPLVSGMDLSGLPALRRIYVTRASSGAAADSFSSLLRPSTTPLPSPSASPEETLAVLPYSSGTTGLPKGVMLTQSNIVTNVYQLLGALRHMTPATVALQFLPLYHIYGMNVVMNSVLALGATLVLMPRWDIDRAFDLLVRENVTWMPTVPPIMAACCHAAEEGRFPRNHSLTWVKCGAAPVPPELSLRFHSLTGVRVLQGYGMTEASPVTHCGFFDDPWYRPQAIGAPVALTDCRILDDDGNDVAPGSPGELVMRGPQFMTGYWNAPEATSAVLRDGWYWSGDIATTDADGFYYIVDRRKELIKYKGFSIAPAEIEAVLLEHPAVRDCGVVGRSDDAAGEVPCAFVVLRDGRPGSSTIQAELCGYVAERLTGYKQPRDVRFVASIPRNPSGKILRRELRNLL